MAKRKREGDEERGHEDKPYKLPRAVGRNCFLDLSDELVLKIFSYFPVSELAKTERVCKRFKRLASDNEIWREKFYVRFIRQRARRIPAVNALSHNVRENQALYYASKTARWLEHNTNLQDPAISDWKRRYKVKLNWTKGRCKAHEVALDCPYSPRILVKICDGTIYTADERKLRSYSQRARPQILQTHYWEHTKRPSSMAVDKSDKSVRITVGFSDGSIEILKVEEDGCLMPRLHHTTGSESPVTSLALAWPYILIMSANHQITLLEVTKEDISNTAYPVAVLASLRCDAQLLPVSLSIRKASNTLVASIAYSFSRLNSGWCLGLQEIRLGLAGDILGSRLTSTIETPMRDFPLQKRTICSRSTSTAPFALHPNLMNPPTSLSHSGCYILAGLPDNTLMVYTVVSDHDKLEISAGRRLFGHTSSVSGAEVSDRGKALSISTRGDEIRVWELEEVLSSWSLQKTSTQLQPQYNADSITVALAKRGVGLGLALQEIKEELSYSRHWVGFDDEQVVVLGEKDQRQILSCYDFA